MILELTTTEKEITLDVVLRCKKRVGDRKNNIIKLLRTDAGHSYLREEG